MYDLLKFIDSQDVREHNKNTYFAPAEWAVIIGLSITRTVEEKIDALQYLLNHHDEKGVREENVKTGPWFPDYGAENMPSRDVVMQTVRIWQDILRDRYRSEGFVYAAMLSEKTQYLDDQMDSYRFFTSYDKACAYLSEKKKDIENEEMENTETYSKICRIKLDEIDRQCDHTDVYLFDAELRLVAVWGAGWRMREDEDGGPMILLDEPDYPIYVPLPFKKGDIVKVDSLCCRPLYGVVPCDWKKPAKGKIVNMWMPLAIYNEPEMDFDYVDGGDHDILRYTYCTEEELPEDQQVLKLIRDVRKGDLDFYQLLCSFEKKGLERLLEWRSEVPHSI